MNVPATASQDPPHGVPAGGMPVVDEEAVRQTRAVSLRWLRAALVSSILAPALLFAYVASTTQRTAIAEGRAQLSRVAQVAQEHAARVVETNEVISRAVFSALGGQANGALTARQPELHAMLRGLGAGLKQVQSIWIWDEQGRPVASSIRPDPPATLSVRDREYFRWAETTRERSWFVSEPLLSRTTGQPFFDFSKRREDAAGAFTGALSVSLFPRYFSEFFAELVSQEAGFAVALLRSDGTLISRYPPNEAPGRLDGASPLLAAMQAGRAEGETTESGEPDGLLRLGAFRRIGDLPMYVAVTADRDELLAEWRRSMMLLALFIVPLASGLTALCWFAMKRVQGEQALSQALETQYQRRLRTEQALRQAQKMEALGQLTGGVAHDFNNILMVVQSSAALAQKLHEQGKPPGSAMERIFRAVNTGAQLTRQLLAIARRQPQQRQAVRLQDSLPEIGQLLRSTLGRSVNVRTEVDAGLPAVVVDQAELELAVINLCVNARDAMPSGGDVVIRARHLPGGGHGPGTVAVSVSDQGQGIPDDLRQKVLEPFFTTKPIGKGTGLGLSQVQMFAQQSGGDVTIESAPGQGTTVTMLLPAVDGPAPASAAQAITPSAPTLWGRVLLVEDNPDIAVSLKLLLEGAGLSLVTCATAESALDSLRSGTSPPHVVLSDVSLAGSMTGVDLARVLAEEFPQVHLLLMTGYTDRLEEAVRHGFTVLAKPVAPADLYAALAAALPARAT